MTNRTDAIAVPFTSAGSSKTPRGRLLLAGLATGAAVAVALGLTLAPAPVAAQSNNGQSTTGAANGAAAGAATGAATGQPQQPVEISDAKRHKIERLLDLTRVDRTVEQIKPLAAKQMGEMLQKRAPEMGQVKRARLVKTVATTFEAGRDELTQALLPVYAKTFTEDELDHMLSFYDSPTGQAIAGKLPQAVGMSRRISQQWSQQMAQQAFQQVKQDAAELGYQL